MSVAAPLVLTGAVAAHADGPDTQAPQIAEYSVTSDDGDDDLTYFVEHEPATFTATVRVTDETGSDGPIVRVRSVDTGQSVGFGRMERVSGDAHDGVYARTITIPEGHAPGDWEVTIYPLSDSLGNSTDPGEFAYFATLGVVDIVYGTPVSPAAVTFDDDARTYTIPAAEGAQYLVDGEVADAGTYSATGTVEITASALDGYILDGESEWTHTFAAESVTAGAPAFDDRSGSAEDTVTIPATDGVEYLVNGEVVGAGDHAASGTVTVTARALSGYELTGTTTWTHGFDATTPFIDVEPGVEHFDHMAWMAESEISYGWQTPDGPEYRPLSPVNRDAMAAFLYRMADEPAVDLPESSPFTDMHPGQQHYKEVVWAYQEGITTGWTMPDGTHQFRPVEPINRDAMAAFMHRFAGAPDLSVPSAQCFEDVPTGMLFAEEMCWMKSEGLSTGWSDGTYRPLTPVKRDAMAAFLHRFDTNF
ncbi:hypothetical protein CFK38_04710 [Brachybacterium vulturis]|uniref:SLH domain-containing protein n=2 Tax=Brachybacterium vulturis TaxID=2017484 RepID=A0A291GL26_9MICO|nr:hypothetical protein CFK38_04710 [Brachybacterium vulturis]